MKKNNKSGFFSRSFLRKSINVILISALSITLWEIVQKQIAYRESKVTYKMIQEEKNNTDNIQDILSEYNCDWITVTNTAIDYPLMQAEDNDYYMDHNYKHESDIGGAIFYDAYDKPSDDTLTVIYGHSMKNGTMFNNLHYFQQDHKRFEESRLIITTEEGEKTYAPLGYYVTDNDFFYKNLDDKFTADAVDIIKKKSDYFVHGTEVLEGAHIMTLYTCDYSISKDGRLIVFYIEEVQ